MTPEQIAQELRVEAYEGSGYDWGTHWRVDKTHATELLRAFEKAARLEGAKAMQEWCARRAWEFDWANGTEIADAIRDLNPEESDDLTVGGSVNHMPDDNTH